MAVISGQPDDKTGMRIIKQSDGHTFGDCHGSDMPKVKCDDVHSPRQKLYGKRRFTDHAFARSTKNPQCCRTGLLLLLLFGTCTGSNSVSDLDDYTLLPCHRMIRHVGKGLTEIPSSTCDQEMRAVMRLFLSNNSIEQISAGALQDYPYLEVLFLDSNQIWNITVRAFENMTNLKEINLNHNSLTSLKDDAFNGAVNLHMVDLSHNRLISVGRTFRSLTRLEILHLDGNQIKFILPGAFFNSPHIKLLDLHSNRLTYLEDDIFQNQSVLQTVCLSGNSLKFVNMSLWSSNDLSFVELSNNPVEYITNVPTVLDNLTASSKHIKCTCQNLPALMLITTEQQISDQCPDLDCPRPEEVTIHGPRDDEDGGIESTVKADHFSSSSGPTEGSFTRIGYAMIVTFLLVRFLV